MDDRLPTLLDYCPPHFQNISQLISVFFDKLYIISAFEDSLNCLNLLLVQKSVRINYLPPMKNIFIQSQKYFQVLLKQLPAWKMS